MLMEKVTEILVEASAEAVEPRFRALADGEVMEKAPGEIVTVADREAERIIARRLRELLPVPVVGEEAVAADPELARALHAEPAAWLVDPVDGTRNFVAGRSSYAVMASLVRHGETVASWIWQPCARTAYTAELGAGAWRDGERLALAKVATPPEEWTGILKTRYIAHPGGHRLLSNALALGPLDPGRGAAGIEYPLVADGALGFLLYWRTLPWDHAPGSLLVTEAGGRSARFDGSPYRPEAPGGTNGLLVAADPEQWETLRGILLEGV
ncbi:putative inositol monophosphatase [Kitasatospora setae KM-6054]|uniref:Putative inositol monophosphatase n=1 Tax=Kitasatospora setae (strain ATCC 33774 / DSM 43861 / JCM 3304 / KCC A-0304 / NBRC 14216 / KM-6054) TaxID=452652 RepID=E4N1I4_KITSK|nr:putative inositol monophosphatase [Kitasatospora setae KM-6054]